MDGTTYMVQGKVTHLGSDKLRRPFLVSYSDGSTERMTLRQVHTYLQPLDTVEVTPNLEQRQPDNL